ncbi:uncharacterized protein LOC135936789 [Cloeon dipterum]|uniref:uncharacterized protein LOC135936789 n=1 Tax=Cloeon dipterum TaxID=197152 RepID=UPI00321F7A1F
MNLVFSFVTILLSISLTTAVNFTRVTEWPDKLASRPHTLQDGISKTDNLVLVHMAVFEEKMIFSVEKLKGTSVTLVSLLMNDASAKFIPFPSSDMHEYGNCDKFEVAAGIRVESFGRLLMLDEGSFHCNAKIWAIDMKNKNQIKLIHRFSFHGPMHDLVIQETPNGKYFAYISRVNKQHIVVYSSERNESWIAYTPGTEVFSIALSSEGQEPVRQLYFSKYDSTELYSISVAALRNGTRTANPKLIGKWSAIPNKMEMDNHDTLHASFLWKNYTSSWNTSEPFKEQRFHEVAGLNSFVWPITFAWNERGTLYMTVFHEKRVPKFELFRVEDSATSINASSGKFNFE